MDKLLDILARLEFHVDIEDGAWRDWMISLIHQAMDIAVKGKAHKWSEEKPERETEDEYKQYLLRLYDGNAEWYQTSSYFDEGFGYLEKYITHWWELPEVVE